VLFVSKCGRVNTLYFAEGLEDGMVVRVWRYAVKTREEEGPLEWAEWMKRVRRAAVNAYAVLSNGARSQRWREFLQLWWRDAEGAGLGKLEDIV
jgi:hypothetical protein